MENLRFPLIAALLVIGFLGYQSWQKDYAPQSTTPEQTEFAENSANNQASTGALPAVPSDNASTENQSEVPSAPGEVAATKSQQTDNNQRWIRVETDVYIAEISTVGGSLQRLTLKNYEQDTTHPDGPRFQLLNNGQPYYFVAQTGLVSSNADAPSHLANFSAERSQYQLAENQNEINVVLRWASPAGVEVSRIWTFTRGSYEVTARDQVTNNSDQPWSGAFYAQLQRNEVASASSEVPFVNTFNGAGIYEKEGDKYKYRKYSFEDLDEESINLRFNGGWIAMIQHYFFGVALPANKDETNRYYIRPTENGRYIAGFVGPNQNVALGQTQDFSARYYLGPKQQENLEAVAEGLTYTVDYGILTPLAKPMFWVMNKMYSVVGNWGVVIILITLLIKLVFYKLSEAQYRSMAKMRRFAPRIKTLRERYADDRQKMNQAMMDLYKKEKFNPLGGCLPMLVQIPVFIALYWVLLESVELRGAPFMLWIQDLSTQDPYFVLPILMGAAMFAQQKLSSQSMAMDPMQAKIMQYMPLMFCAFFAFFPAGLVLYWFMNTLLGMLQQLYITKKVDAEAATRS